MTRGNEYYLPSYSQEKLVKRKLSKEIKQVLDKNDYSNKLNNEDNFSDKQEKLDNNNQDYDGYVESVGCLVFILIVLLLISLVNSSG